MAVFRVNKTKDYTVMSNHHLRDMQLSLKAKGLLSLMLSLPESWDYTTKGLAYICKDGVDSICTGVKELERSGYVTRARLRDGYGKLGDILYTIHEQPIAGSPKRENPVLDNPVQEKPILENPKQEKPVQSSIDIVNTHPVNTDEISTYPSIYPPVSTGSVETDTIDTMGMYQQIILENIDYDQLIIDHDKAQINELVLLMLDCICSRKTELRIGGMDIPTETVRKRFLTLNQHHIEYVIDCLGKSKSKVQNIRAYILTALYNAPVTIENYYRAAVRHDLNGGF